MRRSVVAVLLAAAPVALPACDLCAVYTAGMAHGETSGWYAGSSEQFTRYDELREEGHSSTMTGPVSRQLDHAAFVGYGVTDRLSLQLNVPYIDRRSSGPRMA